jgi:hypothetical protein
MMQLAIGSNAFLLSSNYWFPEYRPADYNIVKFQPDYMTGIFDDYYFHPDYSADDIIYPNPASDIIKFKVPIFGEQMIIKDIFGNECLVMKNQNGLTSIDISKLTSGLYFLNITNNLQIKIYKFVKTK